MNCTMTFFEWMILWVLVAAFASPIIGWFIGKSRSLGQDDEQESCN